MTTRGLAVAAWVATAALVAAAPCAAQTTLRAMHVSATLDAITGSADISVEYTLRIGEPASATFQLIGFGQATTKAVTVDAPVPGTVLPLQPASGSRRVVELGLDSVQPGSELRVTGTYRIDAAIEHAGGGVTVRLPVLTPTMPIEAGVANPFSAVVHVPDGWVVSDSFPSGLRPAGVDRYGIQMPVLPSIIRVQARSDGAWRPGLPLVLDLVAVLVVAGFALGGWRHLRSLAAAPATNETRR